MDIFFIKQKNPQSQYRKFRKKTFRYGQGGGWHHAAAGGVQQKVGHIGYMFDYGRVADPDGVYPDPDFDPTFKKKQIRILPNFT